MRIQFASLSPQSAKVRKFLKREARETPGHVLPCIAASKCETYDIPKAIAGLTSQGLNFQIMGDGQFAYGKINQADLFVLSNGSVVAWNMEEVELVQKILPLLVSAEVHTYKHRETEDMDYVEDHTPKAAGSGMVGDVIYINGSSSESRLMDKMALSWGLARAAKLSALELATIDLIDEVKIISSEMADGHDTGLRSKDVEKLTGRLLQIRGSLNLYSEITETPDLFWTNSKLESLYNLISRKLDVIPRIEIVNKKLDYVANMVSILRNHLNEKTSVRLEWMIVILIAMEFGFEIVHAVY